MLSHDIANLIARICAVDLRSADAATLQSVGGLLSMLLYSHPSAPSLLSSVHEAALMRFKESSTMEEHSQWLRVLMYISNNDRDALFADVLDDAEFQMLDSLLESVESWQEANPSVHSHDTESAMATEWQFQEQRWRSRLHSLCHVSLPLLSGLSEADLVNSGCRSLYSAVVSRQLFREF